ncbi:MAG: sigma-70 family RNA polymerase sigma factor [bacterium]|nr:sigma-70 family RNA polymerase sigma factor [bacterium]
MFEVKVIDFKNIAPVDLFKLLYKFAKPLKKWVKSNSGSDADAEDVLQDAMIVFYQLINRPAFELSAKPETLLFSIGKKIWYNQLRKNKQIPFDTLHEDWIITEEESEQFERESQFQLMEKSLVLLGKKCADLLEMFYFKKFSMLEIANKLDFRNEKVAKAMKYKCLEKARIIIHTKTQDL